MIQRINKELTFWSDKKWIKPWSKINKKKKMVNTQFHKIRNEKGAVTRNSNEMYGIIKEYFKTLYPNTWKL
jgi:hypothetical protein